MPHTFQTKPEQVRRGLHTNQTKGPARNRVQGDQWVVYSHEISTEDAQYFRECDQGC